MTPENTRSVPILYCTRVRGTFLLSLLWLLLVGLLLFQHSFFIMGFFFAHPPLYENQCGYLLDYNAEDLFFSFNPFPTNYPNERVKVKNFQKLPLCLCPLTGANYRYVVLDGKDYDCALIMDDRFHADGSKNVGFALRVNGDRGNTGSLTFDSSLSVLFDEMIESLKCGGFVVADTLATHLDGE